MIVAYILGKWKGIGEIKFQNRRFQAKTYYWQFDVHKNLLAEKKKI